MEREYCIAGDIAEGAVAEDAVCRQKGQVLISMSILTAR